MAGWLATVLTIFPDMFPGPLGLSLAGKALQDGVWGLEIVDIRDFARDKHRSVDDAPFGGGPGMVMLAEPLALAVASAQAAQRSAGCAASRVVALTPGGEVFADARARELAAAGCDGLGLILVCGRYEGIDQRFLDACVDEEISLGDFVLSGGELAAMAVIDAIVRHLPGALKEASAADESFANGLLDAAQFTRPETWRGTEVPAVLLSGHHAQVARWRREQMLMRTQTGRPDLLVRARQRGLVTASDEVVLRGLDTGTGRPRSGTPLQPPR